MLWQEWKEEQVQEEKSGGLSVSGNQDVQYVSLSQQHEESLQSVPERRGGTIFHTRLQQPERPRWLSQSQWERESVRGEWVRRGRKSGVMPNFLTVSERERKVIEPIERIKKKEALESDIMWVLSESSSRSFLWYKSLAVLLKFPQKFHCESQGHSEVENEKDEIHRKFQKAPEFFFFFFVVARLLSHQSVSFSCWNLPFILVESQHTFVFKTKHTRSL